MTVELDEAQRQMILLAVAHLALERPGWADACMGIAETLKGRSMYDDFKVLHQGRLMRKEG